MKQGLTAQERKDMPITRGALDYFPDAILYVSEVSRIGNEQHNPGQPMHWAKEKSTDEADALVRHLLDRGTYDSDGIRHTGKVAWRALALLQRELDAEREGAVTAVTVSEATDEEKRLSCDWVNTGEHDPWCPQKPEPRITYRGYDLSSGVDVTVEVELRGDLPPVYTIVESKRPFVGYGGTGDPSTRSARENAVHAALLPPPSCPHCGHNYDHALDCPAWP